MPKKVRETDIKIRCFNSEKAAWKDKADAANISVANLIRRLLNTTEVERAPQLKTPRKFTEADERVVHQIARIGNNLNQIARQVNQSGVGNGEQLLIELITIHRSLRRIKNAL